MASSSAVSFSSISARAAAHNGHRSRSATTPATALRNKTQAREQKNDGESRKALVTRRDALLFSVLPFGAGKLVPPAEARERRNRKVIPAEDYLTSPEGLKYYDLLAGNGPVAEKGATVQVHFDCIYRGITAVSSRESKLLAGNRIIAQPYQFTIGATPGKERKRDYVDNANGLFSAQAAPKPPGSMLFLLQPGATFELNVELANRFSGGPLSP